MTIKRWIVGLFLAVLLVSEIFLFLANQQKSAAQAQLHASLQQVADLQSQLDQLQSSSTVSMSNEIVRLRRDNVTYSQSLAAAQNSITQLQTTNRYMMQQLASASAYFQQQQGQMEQMAAESQQAKAAAQAALAAQQTRNATQIADAQRAACINNLRQIDAAKQQWALEYNKSATDVPTLNDLLPYLKDGIFPACPAGGLYSINAMSESPTCSVPGHVLP